MPEPLQPEEHFIPMHKALDELWNITKTIETRLSVVENKQIEIKRAFSLNDLGAPDYDGHRQSHLKIKKAEESMEGYKSDGISTLLKMSISGLVFALSIGLITLLARVV